MKKPIILLTAVLLSVNALCQTIDTYKNLSYYQNTYEKAKRQVRTGTVLTIAGVTCGALGYFMAQNYTYQNGAFTANATAMFGSILFLGGAVLTNVGIPLWISGAIKAKNNKEKIVSKFGLQAGLNSNGFGLQLVLKF